MTRQITRSIVVPVRLALLTLAATVGCRPSGAGPVKFETVKASKGDLVQHATASGSPSAGVSVDVGSQVSGKVAALYADYNSRVTKGQLVAEIDSTVYAAALRQSEGDLPSAKATVTLKQIGRA